MATAGFLLMFFGLLAAGMPIFLVLGACAAVLYFVSDQPLIGLAQNMIDQLNSSTLDVATALCYGGRLHASRRRGARPGRFLHGMGRRR
jgi:hypothetical protein